jgi:hypothetical protein
MHSYSQQWMEMNAQLHASATLLPGQEPPGLVGPRVTLHAIVKIQFLAMLGIEQRLSSQEHTVNTD